MGLFGNLKNKLSGLTNGLKNAFSSSGSSEPQAPEYRAPAEPQPQTSGTGEKKSFWNKFTDWWRKNDDAEKVDDTVDEETMEEESNEALNEFEEEERESSASDGDDTPPDDSEDAGAEDSAYWLDSADWHFVRLSTNVFGACYNRREQKLYVRYLHWEPGVPFGERQGPGAIYCYHDVPEHIAMSLFDVIQNEQSAGEWVWSYLRERGFHSGGQYYTTLVQGVGNYIPRESRFLGFFDQEGPAEEWVRREGYDGWSKETAPALPLSRLAKKAHAYRLAKYGYMYPYDTKAAAHEAEYQSNLLKRREFERKVERKRRKREKNERNRNQ